MSRIGLLLGSFDPPHLGHVSAYEYAKTQLDDVWVIPAWSNPWKKHKATYHQRLQMCHLMFPAHTIISDIEDYIKPTYTYEILEKLKEIHPDKQLYLVLGDDENPVDWKNGIWIVKNFNTLYVPRFERQELGIKASSTEIRNRIAEGNKQLKPFLNRNIISYIKTNKLYVTQENH